MRAIEDALGERGARCPGVEEIGCLEEPVAAALDPLERKPRRLGVLQDLRNAGAGQADLGGEIFAGVECPIGRAGAAARIQAE